MRRYNKMEVYGEPPKKSLRERWEETTKKARTWAKSEGVTKAINAVKNYNPRGYEETGQHQAGSSRKKKGKHTASPFGTYHKPQKGTEFAQDWRWP